MMQTPRTLTVAAAQLPARPLEDSGRSLTDIAQAVAAAARAGADLVVLPECAYPCYWLGSQQRYHQANLLDSRGIQGYLANLARQYGLHIVAGLVEPDEAVLYDAAILIDPEGRIRGRHHKTFLWDREHEWYQRGRSATVIDTAIGRIGVIICAEGRSPELFDACVRRGADLLAMPTGWVNASREPGGYSNPQPEFLIEGRAIEFGRALVCANKFGQEAPEARFCGMSMIVAGDGKVLAKAPPDEPALLVDRITLPAVSSPADTTPAEPAAAAVRAEPVLPGRDVQPQTFAVVRRGGSVDPQGPTPQLASLATEQKVRFLVAASQADGEALRAWANRAGLPLLCPPAEPTMARTDRGTFGLLRAADFASYVAARRLALAGAHMLVVFGPIGPLPLLRTRAVENRVFLAAVSPDESHLIEPSGRIAPPQLSTAQHTVYGPVDLAEAAAKQVADATDIWQERLPER